MSLIASPSTVHFADALTALAPPVWSIDTMTGFGHPRRIVPVRAPAVGFGPTFTVTVALPAPDGLAVIVNHGTVLVAAQPHPELAVTSNCAVPPLEVKLPAADAEK